MYARLEVTCQISRETNAEMLLSQYQGYHATLAVSAIIYRNSEVNSHQTKYIRARNCRRINISAIPSSIDSKAKLSLFIKSGQIEWGLEKMNAPLCKKVLTI